MLIKHKTQNPLSVTPQVQKISNQHKQCTQKVHQLFKKPFLLSPIIIANSLILNQIHQTKKQQSILFHHFDYRQVSFQRVIGIGSKIRI